MMLVNFSFAVADHKIVSGTAIDKPEGVFPRLALETDAAA